MKAFYNAKLKMMFWPLHFEVVLSTWPFTTYCWKNNTTASLKIRIKWVLDGWENLVQSFHPINFFPFNIFPHQSYFGSFIKVGKRLIFAQHNTIHAWPNSIFMHKVTWLILVYISTTLSYLITQEVMRKRWKKWTLMTNISNIEINQQFNGSTFASDSILVERP